MEPATYVFIDANIALHFKRLDQIDWPSLTGSPAVTLVLTPVFFREVDQEKVENPKKNLRERAASTLRWLDSTLSVATSADIRRGVTLTALTDEPQIDFAENRLSTAILDDHLIASVLDFSSGGHTGRILVATADVGLKQKLRSRKLEPLALAEADRLPEELDPVEKELEDTKRELHSLKFRQPALVVEFENRTNRFEFSRPICGARAPLLMDVVRDKHPRLVVHSYQQSAAPATLEDKFAKLAVPGITPSMADRYNSDLDSYFENYQLYLEDFNKWKDEVTQTARLVFVLSNDGRAPAKNIDAIMTFPPDIRVLKARKLSKRPKAPQPPRKPGSFVDFSTLSDLGHVSHEYGPDLFQSTVDIARDYDGVPIVTKGEENRVSFSLRNLKHGFKYTLDPVFIRFPNHDAVRSITIATNISAAELPTKVAHDIHLILAEPGSSA